MTATNHPALTALAAAIRSHQELAKDETTGYTELWEASRACTDAMHAAEEAGHDDTAINATIQAARMAAHQIPHDVQARIDALVVGSKAQAAYRLMLENGGTIKSDDAHGVHLRNLRQLEQRGLAMIYLAQKIVTKGSLRLASTTWTARAVVPFPRTTREVMMHDTVQLANGTVGCILGFPFFPDASRQVIEMNDHSKGGHYRINAEFAEVTAIVAPYDQKPYR